MKRYLLTLVFFPGLLLALPPPLPSAGVVEREIEQEYEAKPLDLQKEIPSVEVDIPEERLKMDSKLFVEVKEICIEGNHVVKEKEIQAWIKCFIGQSLCLADIYKICHLIDQKYAEKGYFLTRSYPPPQNIKKGCLTIRIIEGKIGCIRIEGNQYYKTRFIVRYFEPFCHKTVQYDDFLKALLLLNENSDLSAGVVFEKGHEVGTADLVIRVKDKRPIHLYLNENNYGRDLTTNSQLGGRFDWGNCLMQGDTLSIAEVIGFPVKALYFTDATYKMPLNAKGTFLEFAGLFSKFHIEELQELHLRGQSVIGTLKATHAIKRTKTLGVDVFGYFDYKQIQNFELGDRISYDKLRVVTAGTLVDHYNASGGRDYCNIRVAAGIPHFLGGLKSVSDESSRVGGGGRFVQFNADYDRLQRLYKEWLLYVHVSGQWSPYKLTLPQQIYIGGSNTVRGYPLSVALGDSGYWANFETRFPLPIFMNQRFLWTKKKWKEALQLVAFLDTGGTFFNDGGHSFITGAGFGVRIYGPWTFALSFDLGFPFNHKYSSGAFNYLKITANPF